MVYIVLEIERLLYNNEKFRYKEYYGGVYLHISSVRRLCLGINEGTLGNIYAAILLVSEDYSKSFFFIFCVFFSQHKKSIN